MLDDASQISNQESNLKFEPLCFNSGLLSSIDAGIGVRYPSSDTLFMHQPKGHVQMRWRFSLHPHTNGKI